MVGLNNENKYVSNYHIAVHAQGDEESNFLAQLILFRSILFADPILCKHPLKILEGSLFSMI
jgi:hypothetical protein